VTRKALTFLAVAAVSLWPAGARARIESGPRWALLGSDGTIRVFHGNVLSRSARVGVRDPVPRRGRFLAATRDGRTVYALVSTSSRRSAVAVVSATSSKVMRGIALPTGIAYRALVRTGSRLVVAGDRAAAGGRDAVAVLVDPRGASRPVVHVLETAGGYDWVVYEADVSSDGRRLAVGFHGTRTTGGAVYSLPDIEPVACGTQEQPGVACVGPAHGTVRFFGSAIVATTGTPAAVVEARTDGSVLATVPAKLAGDHLTELALDVRNRRVYALGSCGYTGGLSMIDLRSKTARVLARPNPHGAISSARPVCGDRIALLGRGRIALAQNFPPMRGAARGSAVEIVGTDGKLLRRIPVRGAVDDLVRLGP
jgi:hypothetical protein